MLIVSNKYTTLLFVFLTLHTQLLYTQGLQSAKESYFEKKYIQAKEYIDNQVLEDGDIAAESLFWKAKIYHALGRSAEYNTLVAAAADEAFESIKKAGKLDNNKIISLLAKEKNLIISEIYKGYVSEGVAFFNTATETNSTAQYQKSVVQFKKAAEADRFFVQQGWKRPYFDTVLYYNAAQAAINARQEDDALLFCPEIVQKGVKKCKNHPETDFLNIYKWVVAYFNNKGDQANLLKYATAGTKQYRSEPYFITNAIQAANRLAAVPQLLELYKDALQRFPAMRELLLYAYCMDIGNLLYTDAGMAAITDRQRSSAGPQLEKALQTYSTNYPDSSKGFLLTGKTYYNKAAYLQKMKSPGSRVAAALQAASRSLEKLAERFPSEAKPGIELLITIYRALGRQTDAAKWLEKLGE